MEKVKITGGGRIGLFKASWPFVTLEVTKDKLQLDASILGNLVFLPEDIVSIQSYKGLVLFGGGVQIIHSVPKYSKEVVFMTNKNPADVISQIHGTGFSNNLSGTSSHNVNAIRKQQATGGFPIKKHIAVIYIILWNLLSLGGILVALKTGDDTLFLTGMSLGLGLVMASAVLMLVSDGFAKLLLKEGRTVQDLKKFLIFLLAIGTFILLNLTMVFSGFLL